MNDDSGRFHIPETVSVRSTHVSTHGAGPLDGAFQALSTGPLTLVRAWPRSFDHALAEYRSHEGIVVAAQWFRDPQHASTIHRKTPGTVLAQDDTVVFHPHGADRKLAGLSTQNTDLELLVHRPERRAVLRQSVSTVHEAALASYLKVVRPSKVASLVRSRKAVDVLSQQGMTLPQLIAQDEARGFTEWTAVPGVTVHEGYRGNLWSGSQQEMIWRHIGKGLAAFHKIPIHGLGEHEGHDRASELAVLRRWLDLARHLTGLEVSKKVLTQIESSLFSIPASEHRVIHRDLHDKQLLIDDQLGLGMIDIDTLTSGDPMLDLGNLFAHLELRMLQQTMTPEEATRGYHAFLQEYQPDPSSMLRLQGYLDAARVRLMAVYAFRPHWRAVVASGMRPRIGGPLLFGDQSVAHSA